MEKVEEETYLGDIISNSGTCHSTVISRAGKGFGISNELISIIDEIPLGGHRVATGMKLREAMLVNGILFNSEIWYGVKECDITKLEKVDEYLLKGILKAHSKTSRAGLYLESGCIPLRFILKKRSVMYLYHILNRKSTELIRKVYEAQKRAPVKDDWVEQVENDLKELEINLGHLKNVKKNKFKKILKEKILQKSFQYLKNISDNQSKLSYNSYKKLRIQDYLISTKFSNHEKELLIKLRTRMVDVKDNFKQKYEDNMSCDLCGEYENQQHLLECKTLIENCKSLYDDSTIRYEDLFSTVNKQLSAVKLFTEVLQTRQKLLDEQNARNLVQCTN